MLGKLLELKSRLNSVFRVTEEMFDMALETHQQDRQDRAPNPFNRYGRKGFSQGDEDGLTLEICRRLELETGTFCEFGVGDGLECNTISLAALGWRGFWISGRPIAFDLEGVSPQAFRFYESWVTSANILSLYRQGCSDLGIAGPDVLSFDLDGNDLYFVEQLLEAGVRPKLFIVEYNGRFIPPARWSIRQDDTHSWAQSDYFGASLQSFVDLFARHRYRLICCNAWAGANAFFVEEGFADRFPEVPDDLLDIFQPPNYRIPRWYGHRKDPRTVREVFRRVPVATGGDGRDRRDA